MYKSKTHPVQILISKLKMTNFIGISEHSDEVEMIFILMMTRNNEWMISIILAYYFGLSSIKFSQKITALLLFIVNYEGMSSIMDIPPQFNNLL